MTRTLDASATSAYVNMAVNNGNTSAYFSGASVWDVNDGSTQATGTVVLSSGVVQSITMISTGSGYSVDMHTPEANPWPRCAIDASAGSGFQWICYVPQGLPDRQGGGDQSTFYIMRNKMAKSCGYGIYGKMAQSVAKNAYLPSNAVYNDSYFASYTTTPVNPIMVFENYYATYLLAADGTLWSVGYNNNGNLGRG